MSATGSITGELVNSEIVDGAQEMIWDIPAIREQGARRKAMFNSRLKGLNNVRILNVEKRGQASIPGRSTFRVTLEAPR